MECIKAPAARVTVSNPPHLTPYEIHNVLCVKFAEVTRTIVATAQSDYELCDRMHELMRKERSAINALNTIKDFLDQ